MDSAVGLKVADSSTGRPAGLLLRDATAGDREAVLNLTLAAFQEYAKKLPAHWEDYRKGIVTTLSDVRPAEQILAEEGGTLVGCVLLYPAGVVLSGPNRPRLEPSGPEIRLLAVAPEARGRGVGTVLIRECIRRARQAGAPVLTLHTADVMEVAVRMYERMGFVHVPDLDFHPSDDLTVKGYRLVLGG